MKNVVFRVTLVVFLCSVLRLLITANVVPNSPILVTLTVEALRSSETSVLTRVTWRNSPEDGILHLSNCSKTEMYHVNMCLGLVT
jgi:hypothetical protein